MMGIVFATKEEAKPFLTLGRALMIPNKSPFLLFKLSKGDILPFIVLVAVSGIGKVAAATATAELILKYGVSFIANVGVCGVLSDKLSAEEGELYKISTVVEGDRFLSFASNLEPCKCGSLFKGYKEATLVTTDKAVFDDSFRHDMSLFGDLVDMEGAAIARVARMYGVSYDIIKGVSDFASTGGAKRLRLNLREVAITLSKELLRAIISK